jgi:CheY-like chemotaxis protein
VDTRTDSPTVLVVEDEDIVRRVIARELRACGYTVLEAADGEAALAAADEHDGPIDLLLTDVVMPRMSGCELAERFGCRRRGARVLYMTGYTEDELYANGGPRRGARWLEKPFSLAVLSAAVDKALMPLAA